MPSNPLVQNFDNQSIFLTAPTMTSGTYTNSSGSSVTLPVGKVMGRVTSSDKLAITASASTDGSQNPRFINVEEVVVADGASATIFVANNCQVAEDLIVLAGSDTLDTAVGTAGIIRDLLNQNGNIVVVPETQNAAYANAIPYA
jgi:hypothetical protein